MSATAARELAFYREFEGVGVLAPRGWHCLGVYGSSGNDLLVSPDPIRPARVGNFSGPAIAVSRRRDENSGRYDVAELIARIFPVFRDYLTRKSVEADLSLQYSTFAPYPKDRLTYLSDSVVEYNTPAGTAGLGTHSEWLRANGSPIQGVAILTMGDISETLVLSVRLPAGLAGLTPEVVRQFERDAARRK